MSSSTVQNQEIVRSLESEIGELEEKKKVKREKEVRKEGKGGEGGSYCDAKIW